VTDRPYRVGEIVLMQWHGWLKAFRVVEARMVAEGQIEYTLAMLGMESSYQWQKPASGG
jgi:hypothetical protein